MKANVGTVDRVLRIVAGLVLIGLTLAGSIGHGLDRAGADRHGAVPVLPRVPALRIEHLLDEQRQRQALSTFGAHHVECREWLS